jgi:hypothetical protein
MRWRRPAQLSSPLRIQVSERERATRTWCTPARRLALTPHADVCNMKPGAFTFYSPAACYVHAIGRSETSFLLPTRANQRFCFPPFYCSNSLCSCAQRKGCFAFLCPDKVIRSQQTQLLLHRVLSLRD